MKKAQWDGGIKNWVSMARGGPEVIKSKGHYKDNSFQKYSFNVCHIPGKEALLSPNYRQENSLKEGWHLAQVISGLEPRWA